MARPATTATFFLAAWARRSTSPAALPASEVRSNVPSPVITRSALASAASKPTRSSTHSAPGRRLALAKNTSPAPRPPAAPPPGRLARSGRPCCPHSIPSRSSPAASNGRRAAESDNHGASPAVHRFEDELADAARGGAQRVALLRLEKRQPAGAGALKDRRLRVEPAQLGTHRHAERAGDPDVLSEGARRQHGVEQAVSAIGRWAGEHHRSRQCPANAAHDRVGDLAGAEATLEGGGRDENGRGHQLTCLRKGNYTSLSKHRRIMHENVRYAMQEEAFAAAIPYDLADVSGGHCFC